MVHLLIAALLLVALVPAMPYGYYGVMRWVICAAFVHLAIKSHEQRHEGWMWAWIVAAGIYNPIFRVAASREVWTLVNLATLGAVALALWYQTPRRGNDAGQ